jgi:hypothetical protein
VYVAHEESLGRRLVVKLLAPELAAEVNIERFRREISVVAGLQQACIVPCSRQASRTASPSSRCRSWKASRCATGFAATARSPSATSSASCAT